MSDQIDFDARARQRRATDARRAALDAEWRTTGWGAVGVPWCARCGNHFCGVAYVYDHPWGRKYVCARCTGTSRYQHEPEACQVCGRQFAWLGGHDLELKPRPRPRTHLCSTGCAREYRNRRRRIHPIQRDCAQCGNAFNPTRSDARYCSGKCRMRAWRAGLSGH